MPNMTPMPWQMYGPLNWQGQQQEEDEERQKEFEKLLKMSLMQGGKAAAGATLGESAGGAGIMGKFGPKIVEAMPGLNRISGGLPGPAMKGLDSLGQTLGMNTGTLGWGGIAPKMGAGVGLTGALSGGLGGLGGGLVGKAIGSAGGGGAGGAATGAGIGLGVGGSVGAVVGGISGGISGALGGGAKKKKKKAEKKQKKKQMLSYFQDIKGRRAEGNVQLRGVIDQLNQYLQARNQGMAQHWTQMTGGY